MFDFVECVCVIHCIECRLYSCFCGSIIFINITYIFMHVLYCIFVYVVDRVMLEQLYQVIRELLVPLDFLAQEGPWDHQVLEFWVHKVFQACLGIQEALVQEDHLVQRVRKVM